MDTSEQWKNKIDDVHAKLYLNIIPKMMDFSKNLNCALSSNKTDDITLSYIMEHLNILIDELNKLKYQNFMV